MTLDPVALATRWAHQLPREFARHLAGALRQGPSAIRALQARTVLPASSAAVKSAFRLAEQGDATFAAGILTGRLDAAESRPQITSVWTGPESDVGHSRLTLAVVADLIDEAERELLLASYATVPGSEVRRALEAAANRGVTLTLLLERPEDNPKFNGHSDPFPGLSAERLAWPADARPPDASMHAKLLVIDHRTALVGSANLTGHALERNLECGLLVRGGPVPGLLAQHLLSVPTMQRLH